MSKKLNGIKKIILLTTLTILMLNLGLSNINLQTSQSNPNNSEDLLVSNINENDQYSGLGNNLTCLEYAESTNASQSITNLNTGTNKSGYIDIPALWTGYKLTSTVYNLMDNRTWEQNGQITSSESPWFYEEIDKVGVNGQNYYGNYAGTPPSGTTTGALFVHNQYQGSGDWVWTEEYGCFNQSIAFNRGTPTFCAIEFRYYSADDELGVVTGFVMINDYKMTFDPFSIEGAWTSQRLIIPSSELSYLFTPGNNITVKIGLESIMTAVWNGGLKIAECYFDNISLWIEAPAYPVDLDLRLNNQPVQNIDNNYGVGTVTLTGSWYNPSSSNSLTYMGNFSVNCTKVRLNFDFTIFVQRYKGTQNSTGDLSSEFFVTNGESVNWTVYFYGAKPPSFTNYNYTMYFPSDWSVWSAIDPNLADVLPLLNQGSNYLAVSSERANNFPGIWTMKMNSPNYVTNIKFYKNTTADPQDNDWVETNYLFAGDYLNVTGYIKTDGLFTQLTNTKAILNIKFPNGTLWSKEVKIQSVSSNSNGKVFFERIKIPDSGPDYVVGDYKIFVNWNNSFGGYGINETGMMMKTLNIKHKSILTPNQYYYADRLAENKWGITVQFNDLLNNDAIRNALVYFTNFTGQTQTMTEISPGYYYTEISALSSKQGENGIKIYGNHSDYENISTDIIFEVVLGTKLDSINYPTVTVPWNVNASIQLNFTTISNDQGITGATFTNDWSGEKWIQESGNGIYYLHLNTSTFSANSVIRVNITTQDIGYNPATILIDVLINARDSSYTLFLDQVDKTILRSVEKPMFTTLNISFNYIDILNSSIISGATLNLQRLGSSDQQMILTNGLYYIELNIADLGLGVHALNITASAPFSKSLRVAFTITVLNRDTEYKLFLNETDRTVQRSRDIFMYQTLNVSISYSDSNGTHLNAATVKIQNSLLGEQSLTLINGIFQYTIDSATLGVGIHSITAIANMTNYKTISFTFTVNILNRPTEFRLYLNEINKTDNRELEVNMFSTINVSINYIDSLNKYSILSATINLQGIGASPISLIIQPNGLYYYELDTRLLGVGIHLLTINVSQDNYQGQLFTFTINVLKKESSFILYLNEEDKTIDRSLTIDVIQTVNISLSLFDKENTNIFISGSTISVRGIGATDILMNEENGIYQIQRVGTDLGSGVKLITLIVESENYSTQIVYITLTVIPRSSGINIFLNSENITLTLNYEVYITHFFNLSIDYFDATNGFTILNAEIKLSGVGTSDLYSTYQNSIYQTQINASDLGLGISFLIITATNSSFNQIIITISIVVKQLPTEITTPQQGNVFTVEIGKMVIFGIYLNDTLSNNRILGASVTYSSSFGSGTLTDLDGDGYYTAELDSLPEGIYTVYIQVIKGIEYAFQEFELVVNIVKAPPTGLTPGQVAAVSSGLFALIFLILMYQFYFKYPKAVRKIRKVRKNLKREVPIPIEVKGQGVLITEVYNRKITQIDSKLKILQETPLPESREIDSGKEPMDSKEFKQKIKTDKTLNKETEKSPNKKDDNKEGEQITKTENVEPKSDKEGDKK